MRTSPETLPVPAALHPGLVDPAYRARRDAIAASSALHVPGQPVPTLDYTEEEERTWRAVWNALLPLHREHGASCLVERGDELGLFDGPIPQLEDLNSGALAASGFRFEPVEGLVPARRFFEALGQRTFLSTRFLRHGAEPLYTPEPDLVHEVVGHAAALSLPWLADLAEAFGRAATAASDSRLLEIDRVFWLTMEFGVVAEGGVPKALGAGLMSSAGEISSFADRATLLPFDLDAMIATEYETDEMQSRLFVAPSTETLTRELHGFLGS